MTQSGPDGNPAEQSHHLVTRAADEAARIRSDAHASSVQQAQQIVDVAQQSAAQIREQANRQAESIVQAARAHADQITAEANAAAAQRAAEQTSWDAPQRVLDQANLHATQLHIDSSQRSADYYVQVKQQSDAEAQKAIEEARAHAATIVAQAHADGAGIREENSRLSQANETLRAGLEQMRLRLFEAIGTLPNLNQPQSHHASPVAAAEGAAAGPSEPSHPPGGPDVNDPNTNPTDIPAPDEPAHAATTDQTSPSMHDAATSEAATEAHAAEANAAEPQTEDIEAATAGHPDGHQALTAPTDGITDAASVETQVHAEPSAEVVTEPDSDMSTTEQQAAAGEQGAPTAEAVAVEEPAMNVDGEQAAVTEAEPASSARADAPVTLEAVQEGQPAATVMLDGADQEGIKGDTPAEETTTTTVPVMAVPTDAAAAQEVAPQVGAPTQAPAFTRLFAISPLLTGIRSGQAGKHPQPRAAADPAGPLPEGPIDLVLPETTDRMTTEVLSAVLRQQPGISVGQLTRRGGSLYLPVNLSRPVPLGAILREFPRISTVTYVEGTEQQIRQLAVQLR